MWKSVCVSLHSPLRVASEPIHYTMVMRRWALPIIWRIYGLMQPMEGKLFGVFLCCPVFSFKRCDYFLGKYDRDD
jgi:hypothetical protein